MEKQLTPRLRVDDLCLHDDGMMTGRLLGGNPLLEAVKYQILVMFIISAETGFGILIAVWVASRRLFDERHRLRLARLYTTH